MDCGLREEGKDDDDDDDDDDSSFFVFWKECLCRKHADHKVYNVLFY